MKSYSKLCAKRIVPLVYDDENLANALSLERDEFVNERSEFTNSGEGKYLRKQTITNLFTYLPIHLFTSIARNDGN